MEDRNKVHLGNSECFFFSLAFLSTWPWLWLSGVSDAWIDSDTCYHGISSGELRQVSSLSVQQKILQQRQCLNTKGISKFIYYALNTSRTKKDLKPSSFFQNVVKKGHLVWRKKNKIFHADSVGIWKKKEEGEGRGVLVSKIALNGSQWCFHQGPH